MGISLWERFARAIARRRKIKGESAVAPLIAPADAGDKEGVSAVGAIGSDKAVEPLLEALRHQGAYSRNAREIIRALGDTKSPKAVARLVQILYASQGGDTIWAVGATLRALARIGSEEAIAAILGYVDTRANATNLEEVIPALGESGLPQAVPLLAHYLEIGWAEAATALGNYGSPEAVGALRTAVQSDKANVRAAAHAALSRTLARSAG